MEGTYYLINNWGKYKAFFKSHIPALRDQYFKSEADAKRSITRLLNGSMREEYKYDKFTVIPVSEFEMIDRQLSESHVKTK